MSILLLTLVLVVWCNCNYNQYDAYSIIIPVTHQRQQRIPFLHNYQRQNPHLQHQSIRYGQCHRCRHAILQQQHATTDPNQLLVSKESSSTSLSTSNSQSIYSLPALYDIAFGYRNYVDEVQFLLSKHYELSSSSSSSSNMERSTTSFDSDSNQQQQQQQQQPLRVLEIAAGPARHSITALLLPYILENERQTQEEQGDDDNMFDNYDDDDIDFDDDIDDYNDNELLLDNRDDTTIRRPILLPPIATVDCIDTSIEMKQYAQQVLHDEIEYYIHNTDNNNINDSNSYEAKSNENIKDGNSQQQQQQQLESRIQDRFRYHIADMRDFSLVTSSFNENNNNSNNSPPTTIVDTVWILLGSLQHMLTNDDVIHCFQSITSILQDDGSIFIELPHPRESTFNIMDCTRNGWKIPLQIGQENNNDGSNISSGTSTGSKHYQQQMIIDDVVDDDDEYKNYSDRIDTDNVGELSIVWGDDGDTFDPITQVRQFTIRFDVTGIDTNANDVATSGMMNNGSSGTRSIQQVVPMRLFTAQEIDALARCVDLQVVAMYGALEDGIDVNDEETSYRLIMLLKKRR